MTAEQTAVARLRAIHDQLALALATAEAADETLLVALISDAQEASTRLLADRSWTRLLADRS